VDISASYQNWTGTTHIVVNGCTYSVFPSTVSIPSAGGTATLTVSPSLPGTVCNWTATSSDPFVTITSGTSGAGSGTTTISAPANTGATRSATLTIAGRQVTVSQSSGNCATVSPSIAAYTAELNQGSVTVTAPSSCQWSASSTSTFIIVNNPGFLFTGNGSVSYRVFGNLTGAPRSGSFNVQQQQVNIDQRAALGGNFLSFVSDTGDYIGQGWTSLQQAPTSTITPTIDASFNHLSVSINGSTGLSAIWWNLNMQAPQGQQLVPGTYLNATRWPFQATTVPGLDFSGDGRGCNQSSGNFTITDAAYGAGGVVQRFSATFEQHCEGGGPALRGTIVYVQ
jgi:hypothetical protein